MNTHDLWNWRDVVPSIELYAPEALTHDQWPPDYRSVYMWRLRQLAILDDPVILASAKAYYSTRPAEFIMHWMDTYDPRRPEMKWIPFIFFMRQHEFITFLHQCRQDNESGLAEKCRDAGITWCSVAYSVWSWLFIDDDAIGWGSRKQDLVDKIGNPDSIFEKMRLLIKRLPACFIPWGFNPKIHTSFMKLLNPERRSIIMGEAGDGIGRGGRTAMYFKDESAHYEHAEKIESALGDNTNVQIDISSVNGLGNVFHRRREAGVDWRPDAELAKGFVRVFVVDWRDHPAKDQAWYDGRKAKAKREGMLHVFAQEVERNYAAAVANTVIDVEWIKAATDAHLKIPYLTKAALSNAWGGALDVADEGLDQNALALREGIILRHCEDWGERDPGVTTRNVIRIVSAYKGMKLQYDCIGIGAAVKSEVNRLTDEKALPPGLVFVPWNAGAAVQEPFACIIPDDEESPMNKDFFANLKAQAWWALRTRFYKTWQAVTEGIIYAPDELISLDSRLPQLRQVEKELAQPTSGYSSLLKTMINKKPEGTKSPNLADAICMAYFPLIEQYAIAAQGSYGNVRT